MATCGTPTGYTNGCHGEASCTNHRTGRMKHRRPDLGTHAFAHLTWWQKVRVAWVYAIRNRQP